MLMSRSKCCSHKGKIAKNGISKMKKYRHGAIFADKIKPFSDQIKHHISQGEVEKAFRLLEKKVKSNVVNKVDLITFAIQIRYTRYKPYLERVYKLAKENKLSSIPLQGILFNYLYKGGKHDVIEKMYEKLDIISKKDIGITCIYLNTLRKLKEYDKAIKIINKIIKTNNIIENQIGLHEYFSLLVIKAYCLKDYENLNREKIYLKESFKLFSYVLHNIDKKHEKYPWALCGLIFCISKDPSLGKDISLSNLKEELERQLPHLEKEGYRNDNRTVIDINSALEILDHLISRPYKNRTKS